MQYFCVTQVKLAIFYEIILFVGHTCCTIHLLLLCDQTRLIRCLILSFFANKNYIFCDQTSLLHCLTFPSFFFVQKIFFVESVISSKIEIYLYGTFDTALQCYQKWWVYTKPHTYPAFTFLYGANCDLQDWFCFALSLFA